MRSLVGPALLTAFVSYVPATQVAAENAVDARPRVLILDLTHADSVDNGTVRILDDLLAVSLSKHESLDVLSGADVRRLVALEAERQTIGCTEDASCLAEIAGAMGAQYVIAGNMGKLGSRYILTLTLFDSREAKSVNRVDARATSLDELTDVLDNTIAELLVPLMARIAEGNVNANDAPSSDTGEVVATDGGAGTDDATPTTPASSSTSSTEPTSTKPTSTVSSAVGEGTSADANVDVDTELSFLGVGLTAGLVSLGVVGILGGGVVDLVNVGSGLGANQMLDVSDFAGPGIAAVGVFAVVLGVVFIPTMWWTDVEETP